MAKRRLRQRFSSAILLTALTIFAFPSDCEAYLDPNIGGSLFQLLFPVLVAIAGAWAILRDRTKKFLEKILRRIWK